MKTTKQDIFDIVKQNTLAVLVDIDADAISIDTRLSDLGANSIDRVEVVMYSMEQLGIDVPRTALQGVRDIRSLVDLLHSHCA